MRRLSAWLVMLVLVLVDLAVKEWAHASLVPGEYVRAWTGLGLTHIFNPGVSFGLFANSPSAVLAITAVLTAGVVAWFATTRQSASILPLAWIAAGAVANLIDRFAHGAVSDIFVIGPPQAPLFTNNLADMWISIGVVALLIDAAHIRRSAVTTQPA